MDQEGSVENFLWAFNPDKDWERFQMREHDKYPNVIVGYRYEDYTEMLLTVPMNFRDAILEIFRTYMKMKEEIKEKAELLKEQERIITAYSLMEG